MEDFANDPLAHLTNIILPKMIEKLRGIVQEQATVKERLAILENAPGIAVPDVTEAVAALDRRITDLDDRTTQRFAVVAAACPADEISVGQLLQSVRDLATRVNALERKFDAAPPTETKVRRRRKTAALAPKPENLTADDVLHANYALRATKGDPHKAKELDPDIPLDVFHYVKDMSDEEVLSYYDSNTFDPMYPIPAAYLQANWKNVEV